jgi:outer membrane protein OmpA-like peptidoglycan-associated protein
MRFATGLAVALMTAASLGAGSARAEQATIPLCPGLTIVTAVSQAEGDYESIKIIEAVTDDEVRLRYSNERMVSDMFSLEPPRLERTTIRRTIRRVDLESATLYLQQFSPLLPEMVPETTAVGTSAAVLEALKTKGEAELGVFIAFGPPNRPPADRNVHPNVYSNQMIAPITRVGDEPVMIPLLVNDRLVELPAIHAQGNFFGNESEFFFLDDPNNPLTLKFRYGIDAVPPMEPAVARLFNVEPNTPSDEDVLQVIKIAYECGTRPDAPAEPGDGDAPAVPGGVGPGPEASAAGAALERALADTGRADVYSLYFSFNSDAIREESEPILAEIAGVLDRHPAWMLAINGHTDNVGGDQSNLDLSRRRAAAVKDALVTRHGIAADRLTTAGMGRSQPKDTNETLEGRAQNRRVELVRR